MKEFLSAQKKQYIDKIAAELKAKGGMSDIEIASKFKCDPISEIAEKLDIPTAALEPYGKTKAKVNYPNIKPNAKLVLVTAINPTAAGEGKTTTSIGLTDALARIGKKVAVALREPSLGPVFGVKGGAAGGGLSQVIPMEEINLHFTGDIHAITCANNLLAALIDNHIQQGNDLQLNPKRILWSRCLDLNDRVLRNVVIGEGKAGDGVMRQDHFNITAASEIMAILCLADGIEDLKARLGRIAIAYNTNGELVYAKDIKAENALAILLKEALMPNLVQTLAGTPAFIHGGPFANIAHGCNSIVATKTAMHFADIVVTEAGFGADLGAEKFLDVKCRMAGIAPGAVVIVATVRALKLHGGAAKTELKVENVAAVKAGVGNLVKHVENISQKFKIPAVVSINKFITDTPAEIKVIIDACAKLGVAVCETEVWGKGGAGAENLAHAVVEALEKNSKPTINYTYELKESIVDKINKIAKNIYGAKEVVFSQVALAEIDSLTKLGFNDLPIIIAKTQYSLSDDAAKLGRPEGFTVTIREIQLRNGSGFIVAVAGDVMLMPGLPKVPAANNMVLNKDGSIDGLF